MPWGYAAAAVGGALISADASKSAAGTQAQAAKAASENQMYMYGQTQKNMSPYMDVGQNALISLSDLLGIQGPRIDGNGGYWSRPGKDPTTGITTPDQWMPDAGSGRTAQHGMLAQPFGLDQFQASPAYQFNLEQGQKAIDKAAAKRGNFYAPATLQDISKFSQGLASNEFQNAYSNYNTNMGNIWNRLYSLSSGGQNAAANLGGFGTTVGSQVSNNIIGAGNAQAAGQVGAANAYTGAANNAYNNYMMQQMLANNQKSSVPAGDPNAGYNG